ncbi:MAG TPA: RagB/SusD family nutrient uptake outer membrane protein, partial [Prolixibacteraceae bacterium]|nr:RagB/SusD family nutrient uptake outer membrane protein [Prolixibacteraceae bacterium]
MNRFKKIFIVLIVFFSACNDEFLEVEPLDRYSDAAVWQDPALIEAFVNNIYYGQNSGFNAEMMSSICDESMDVWWWETQPIVKSEINSSYLGILAPDHWDISFRNLTWNNLYDNIRACNVFMENIEESGLTGEEVDQLTGEVLFLRAYYYHVLMSFFGGVPLIEDAYGPGDDFLVPRNSFEETVNFIVKDCDAAAELLVVDGDKARATKGAALTLKSKVLLYAASDLFNSNGSWTSGYSNPELIGYTGGDRTARWQAAKNAAKAVIDMNTYSLYGETNPATPEEARDNYINIFLNHGNEED